jgi:hypothetical protein
MFSKLVSNKKTPSLKISTNSSERKPRSTTKLCKRSLSVIKRKSSSGRAKSRVWKSRWPCSNSTGSTRSQRRPSSKKQPKRTKTNFNSLKPSRALTKLSSAQSSQPRSKFKLLRKKFKVLNRAVPATPSRQPMNPKSSESL